MQNKEVEDYIRKSRQAGNEDNAIRQTLLGSGFSVQDIEEAFSGINAEGSILGNIQHQNPPSYESLSRESIKRSPLKLVVKIFSIILLVLVVIVGGYYVLANYFPEYAGYVQPYLGPVLDPLVDQINSVTGNTPVVSSTPVPTPAPMPTQPPQNMDSDGDGLLDIDEVKYGTDVNKPDTDGDGYRDGEEVQNGYDPLGPGRLNPSITPQPQS